VWGLLAAALLAACASVEPPPPVPGAPARLPPVPESVVGVHASASYAAMGAAVSAAVPPRFANLAATPIGPLVTFDLTGERGPIVLSRAGDRIGYTTDIQIDGSLSAACGGCRTGVRLSGRAWGSAKPTINPDWSLSVDATGQYQIDDAALRLPFAPNVSVGDVSSVLQGPLGEMMDKINQETARSAKLKTAAEAAWSGLGQPIQVSVSPPVWLMVHPTRILTEQPAVTDQGIDLGVAMVARPELLVGDMPAPEDPGPLPNLTLVDQIPQQFAVYLPVKLTWDDANEMATQELVGHPVNAGGGVTVTVDKISIFNNGDELGVKIAFRSRSISGTLYLLGKPVYDLADGYIAIENLHMDISTQNVLVQLAAWLTHQTLIDDLEARLRFNVKSQVEARRADLDRAIGGVQINPRLSLKGQVTGLAPSAIYLTRDGMQVNVVAVGTLDVLLH
jgi:hypothetical protein